MPVPQSIRIVDVEDFDYEGSLPSGRCSKCGKRQERWPLPHRAESYDIDDQGIHSGCCGVEVFYGDNAPTVRLVKEATYTAKRDHRDGKVKAGDRYLLQVFLCQDDDGKRIETNKYVVYRKPVTVERKPEKVYKEPVSIISDCGEYTYYPIDENRVLVRFISLWGSGLLNFVSMAYMREMIASWEKNVKGHNWKYQEPPPLFPTETPQEHIDRVWKVMRSMRTK